MSRRRQASRGFQATSTNHQPARGNPTHSPQTTLQKQAAELIRAGRRREAEQLYRAQLANGDATEETLCNLAVLSSLDNRWPDVIELCDKLLQVNPSQPEVLNNLATLLWRTDRPDEAIECYREAIRRHPDLISARNNLGELLHDKGRVAEAKDVLEEALAGQTANAKTRRLYGLCLRSEGRAEEAIEHFRQALAVAPDCLTTLRELAFTLQSEGHLDMAIASYREVIAKQPGDALIHSNLGIALIEQGEIQEALHAFETALELEPENPEYLYNLGVANLHFPSGYAKGWQGYEWRRRRPHKPSLPDVVPNGEEWDGSPLQPGDTLLAISEQGFGDTLQFIRYIPYLRERDGLRISVCAPTKLHGLIRTSGIDPQPLSPQQAGAMHHDRWISLMSLPGRLGISPERVLCDAPYLSAPSERIEAWRQRLVAERRPLIALNWQGNPNHETSVSRGRSIPLEAMAPIASCCDAGLVAVQKMDGLEQLERCTFRHRFVSCQQQVNQAMDFEDTAAILANCDLVITTDTGIAHLAGGMGKTTWLLLKRFPEWRWGLEGDTSFWYPSMRLFRQRQTGDWTELMQRVAEALQHWVADHAAAPSSSGPSSQSGAGTILAPISLGELVDKITILELKCRQLRGVPLQHANHELEVLQHTYNDLNLQVEPALIEQLRQVNSSLWDIEDRLRDKERQQEFGVDFIELARSVYRQNDCRAALKRQINRLYGSTLVEEKSYQPY